MKENGDEDTEKWAGHDTLKRVATPQCRPCVVGVVSVVALVDACLAEKPRPPR